MTMTKPPEPRAGTVPWWTCADCGKRGYQSRADAKKVRRRVDPHQSVYDCTSGLWHTGHRRGGTSRTNYPSRWRRDR